MAETSNACSIQNLLNSVLAIEAKGKKKNAYRTYYDCLCVCGKIHWARKDMLTSGFNKSCGCKLLVGFDAQRFKHGFSTNNNTHPLYKVWNGIKQRCKNPKSDVYRFYGGKGVTICDEWNEDFVVFYNWAINNGWQLGLTIDRVCNNDGYNPNNCRIATMAQQCRNKSYNVYLLAFGENKCLQDWANDERCLVKYSGLKDRVKKWGWDAERAITTPPLNKGNTKIRKCG